MKGWLTVLDLTQGVAGPLSTRLLSQMGARVIKVERPGTGDIIRGWDAHVDGMSSGHAWVNPGKESIAVDLGSKAGQQIVRRLAARADVVVANFVPGTLERWGLGPNELTELNPRLVVCLISGYGQDGPYHDRSALDLIIQAETGLISTNGTEDQPAKLSLSVADISGAMYATIAILQAVLHRDRSGEGQVIDIALFDSVLTWTGYFPYMYWYENMVPGRVGLHHHTMFPYGAYETSDGRSVVVAAGAGGREHWSRFCQAIERPDLIDVPEYATNGSRLAHRDILEPAVQSAIGAQPLAHWLDCFHAVGIPAGGMNDFAAALEHPVLRHRGLEIEMPGQTEPIRAFDYPPHFSSISHVNELGPPLLGEHTESVLTEIGFQSKHIHELASRDVIQTSGSLPDDGDVAVSH